jgi:SAM-dependent methyltransferase
VKKVDFDQYAKNYNELLREKTAFFSEDEKYFARYKVLIARELCPLRPSSVLEFGCGIGRNIPYLKEAYPDAQVMGSDVSEKSLETARLENPGTHFWREGLSEGERSGFDLVFVAGVFHHIPPDERLAAARTIAARLNPGGTAVVFEHNPLNPVTRKIVSECPYDEGVILLRMAELRDLLATAGLTDFTGGYSLFFPPRLKALARLERFMRWIPFGGQYWVRVTRR